MLLIQEKIILVYDKNFQHGTTRYNPKTDRYEVCSTFDSMTRWRKDTISSKFVEQTSILFFKLGKLFLFWRWINLDFRSALKFH